MILNCLLVGEKNTGKTHYLTMLSAKNGTVHVDSPEEIFQMDACPSGQVVNIIEISNVSEIPHSYTNIHGAIIMISLITACSFDKWYTAIRRAFPIIPIALIINTEKCVRGVSIDYVKYFALSKDASVLELQEPLVYVLNSR